MKKEISWRHRQSQSQTSINNLSLSLTADNPLYSINPSKSRDNPINHCPCVNPVPSVVLSNTSISLSRCLLPKLSSFELLIYFGLICLGRFLSFSCWKWIQGFFKLIISLCDPNINLSKILLHFMTPVIIKQKSRSEQSLWCLNYLCHLRLNQTSEKLKNSKKFIISVC